MKRILLSTLALVCISLCYAQSEVEKALIIDNAEDTTRVNTITDIIALQEMVSKSNSTEVHFSKVWGRKTFFNLGYNMSGNLNPKDDIELGYEGEGAPKYAPEFKIKWGAMLQLGHSYTLHKGAIANIFQINLDYTYIDLNINHYEAEPYAHLYDINDKSHLPWAANKYDLTYGMTLGPSITLAPFTLLKINHLHFLKFNVYYHLGYHAGLLLMDQKADGAKNGINFDYLSWGHGLSKTFGLSLSWKTIGIGWETRTYSPTYKKLSGEESDHKYKFNNVSNRIYLSIRY